MADHTSMKIGTPAVVTLSTSNAQSAAIGTANPGQPGGYTTVRLATTVDAWIEIDADPVAVANTAPAFLLPAGTVEYFDVPFGHKIGAIAAGAGYLSVTPMSKS